MSYFLALQNYFFLCSDIPSEEKKKLDKFLEILEEPGVGKIIEKAYNTTSKKINLATIRINYSDKFFMYFRNNLD